MIDNRIITTHKINIEHILDSDEYDVYVLEFENGELSDADNYKGTYDDEKKAVKKAKKLAREYGCQHLDIVRSEVTN